MSGAALWRSLPPVGDAIHLRRNRGARAAGMPGRPAVYLRSGTEALALLLQAIARRARAAGSQALEVALPAYGCPDIVSAVAHAGLRARLVDLAPDSPFPAAEAWRAAAAQRPVALMTVGFLGLRDPFTPADAYAAGLAPGAALEDCCQVHPMAGLDDQGQSFALSFGRGKPVSLMHGGAALVSGELADWLPPVGSAGAEWAGFARLALTTRLYNVLRSPRAYGWATRLPGIGLGDTRYEPLTAIEPMNSHVLECLDARMGWGDAHRRALQTRLRDTLAGLSVKVLAADLWRTQGRGTEWLLRYPLLLASRELRDAACARLNAAGLGASPMYGRPLDDFEGIDAALTSRGPLPHARSFADRLLTLPLHADVRDRDSDAVGAVLKDLEGRGR